MPQDAVGPLSVYRGNETYPTRIVFFLRLIKGVGKSIKCLDDGVIHGGKPADIKTSGE
jgi:hypothetical protein